MKQVTGLGLDRWQLHSAHPAEVKSGICSRVNMSHSCDNGGSTRPHVVHTAQHIHTVFLLCGSVSRATSVCAISMFGWLGWPHYMATFHTAPSFCLSLSFTHPSQPIIVFLFIAPTQHDGNILWQGLRPNWSPLDHALLSVWSLQSEHSRCVCLAACLLFVCLFMHHNYSVCLPMTVCLSVCAGVCTCSTVPWWDVIGCVTNYGVLHC